MPASHDAYSPSFAVSTTKMTEPTKRASIYVAEKDLRQLKKSGYLLCFSIQINNSYGVVWATATNYTTKSIFEWCDAFELYATHGNSGSETNATKIKKGQKAILESDMILGNATSGGPKRAITLINNNGWIYPALRCWCRLIDGESGLRHCYSAANSITKGQTAIYPLNILKIWFSQDGRPLPLAMENQHAITTVATIDLTQAASGARRYENATWSIPG